MKNSARASARALKGADSMAKKDSFDCIDAHDEAPNSEQRRLFLMAGVAGALAAAIPPVADAAEKAKTSARIVIAGAGAAGLTVASRLAATLDGANIVLIDKRKEHFYQPG